MTSNMFYQVSAPLGLPSAACQSMEHGHPSKAEATDVIFGGENVPWVKKQFGVKVKN